MSDPKEVFPLPESVPAEEPWNCEVDGHEWVEEGEYDPDTGCYPYMQCEHCPKQKDWEPPEDYDEPNWP